MHLEFNDTYDKNIKEFLESKAGIKNVEIKEIKYKTVLDIDCEDIEPSLIIDYINLYTKNNQCTLMEFDKNNKLPCKKLKYVIADICCEYCYKILVTQLFLDKNVKSVKSDFDFINTVCEVEFIIEYYNYEEEELIKIINS